MSGIFARTTMLAGMALLALAGAARADTVQVRDNQPDALQQAIDEANPGDRLEVHRGRYKEAVEVDKALTIVGVGKRRPVIDATCDNDKTIDVLSNGVTLRRLRVRGAKQTDVDRGWTVNLFGIDTGTVRGLVVEQSCPGDRPEYGINMLGTGNIQVIDNRVFGGFEDAGIYVGGVNDTLGGRLLVRSNESYGNNLGIIVEDSFGPDANIVVRGNATHNNRFPGATAPTGIYVLNSDGGRYVNNRANRNGKFGIRVDENSDDNVFLDNTAKRNGQTNFANAGSGNCGSGNSFAIPAC